MLPAPAPVQASEADDDAMHSDVCGDAPHNMFGTTLKAEPPVFLAKRSPLTSGYLEAHIIVCINMNKRDCLIISPSNSHEKATAHKQRTQESALFVVRVW